MAVKYRDIPGYEGKYKVSKCGKVYSIKNGIILRQSIGVYPQVTLSRNKTKLVHHLIALTFLGKRPIGYDINHKDGNKLNNNINNLEYCTRSENMLHKFNVLGYKSPRIIKIKQFSKDGILLKYWNSATYASIGLGISRRAIVNCLKGLSKTSGGFIWKYK